MKSQVTSDPRGIIDNLMKQKWYVMLAILVPEDMPLANSWNFIPRRAFLLTQMQCATQSVMMLKLVVSEHMMFTHSRGNYSVKCP